MTVIFATNFHCEVRKYGYVRQTFKDFQLRHITILAVENILYLWQFICWQNHIQYRRQNTTRTGHHLLHHLANIQYFWTWLSLYTVVPWVWIVKIRLQEIWKTFDENFKGFFSWGSFSPVNLVKFLNSLPNIESDFAYFACPSTKTGITDRLKTNTMIKK
jgi:hypothetical protein